VPGQVERIRIPLLPVAWLFSAGSRIRFSVAGADDDHCGQVPHGRPPLLKMCWGEGHASVLELPLEQNPTNLNREGFPSGTNSDSHCVLGKEASTHGQAFVGGFADQGGSSG
jgi:predicted acyl esterase